MPPAGVGRGPACRALRSAKGSHAVGLHLPFLVRCPGTADALPPGQAPASPAAATYPHHAGRDEALRSPNRQACHRRGPRLRDCMQGLTAAAALHRPACSTTYRATVISVIGCPVRIEVGATVPLPRDAGQGVPGTREGDLVLPLPVHAGLPEQLPDRVVEGQQSGRRLRRSAGPAAVDRCARRGKRRARRSPRPCARRGGLGSIRPPRRMAWGSTCPERRADEVTWWLVVAVGQGKLADGGCAGGQQGPRAALVGHGNALEVEAGASSDLQAVTAWDALWR